MLQDVLEVVQPCLGLTTLEKTHPVAWPYISVRVLGEPQNSTCSACANNLIEMDFYAVETLCLEMVLRKYWNGQMK